LAQALARAEARTSSTAALEARLAESEARIAQLQTDRTRIVAENELVHNRLAELFDQNEQFDRQVAGAYGEVDRLNGILNQIYGSRTWKLHLFLDRARGRR
jgi:septal ring factor EnvC (AmiA/AmiB activator)